MYVAIHVTSLLAGSSEVAHDSFNTGLAIAAPNALGCFLRFLRPMNLYWKRPNALDLH